jgi:uncharacterized repeat protein (TIGR03837 family)
MGFGHTAAIVDNPCDSIRLAMLWDIFCKVIDNHGDIGVCWRLAVEIARRGQQVRLRVDDASALAWMAPQGHPAVQVLPWSDPLPDEPAASVVVEAFGCELPVAWQSALAGRAHACGVPPVWINLEYLTAESFAERAHGLPSPVLSGPAAGLTKHFFYPGFTPGTGGLLREPDLLRRQADFTREHWLRDLAVPAKAADVVVSLFCYEPPLLEAFLSSLARGQRTTQLLVTAGRAAAAVRAALARLDDAMPGWNRTGQLAVSWLPLLAQEQFDHLLWSCDLNLVRGEDSLVRALWAGKPLVWHVYPQQDGAHRPKLDAFLEWLGAAPSLRSFHHGWNGMAPRLPQPLLQEWSACAERARERLLAQEDLASQLMRFVQERDPAQEKR